MAVERHCTSKLPDDDLLRIASLGFRGEALPSIGAVSRMRIISRPPGADSAWEIAVEAGAKAAPVPAAHPPGTRVEVRDLFFATPARLKFLKTPRTERDLAVDSVRRLAMAYPGISFTVIGDEERVLLRLAAAGDTEAATARRARLAALLGRDFAENSVEIDAERGGFRLTGLIGLPTLNRAAPRDQYLVVNGRPVRDKLLVGAVRGAYQDVLARDRHPMVALFVDGPAEEIDVNVHPAKAEVRFRDAASVRGLIVGALRNALAAAGHRASTTVAAAAVAAFRPGTGVPAPSAPRFAFALPPPTPSLALAESANNFLRPTGEAPATEAPLGTARAQLHGTYILAETPTGIVLVDQHAAHERLVYERMKEALAAQGVARQTLLLPEVVELDEIGAARLAARAEELAEFGLVLEAVRARRGGRARGPGVAAGARCRRPGARPRRRARRVGRYAGVEGADRDASAARSPATPACAPGGICRRPRWTRCCARWRRPPIAASAITAARPMSRSTSPTSSGCSAGGRARLRPTWRLLALAQFRHFCAAR